MEFVKVHDYLQKLRTSADYKKLAKEDQEAAVFEASEFLSDHFSEKAITVRAVGLQTLFMIEGEGETFAMLRRQGVKNYAVKGISVSLEAAGVAPDVVTILNPPKRAAVGRIV